MVILMLALFAAADPAAPPATTTTTTTTPAPVPAAARERVLVLDFRNDSAREDLVRIVRDSLVVHLSRMGNLEVLSSDDLRRVADLEAQKQTLGCSDSSCLAELAGAVGARLVVFGNVGQLGQVTQINLSLLDVADAQVRSRESIELTSLEEVPNSVRAAADRMFGVAAPVPETGWGPVPWIGIGTSVAGAVVGVAFGALAGVADGESGLNNGKNLDERRAAQDRFPGLAATAVAGGVVAVIGAGIFAAGLLMESP
ncbi:MAG: hypothetical protein Q8O67_06155 [Deltaproteobacteria bacterium]|nr:hypothetical protein [Deltaproteobacteria bacterium]